MPDESRHKEKRLPEFYLSPSVNGHRIAPEVRVVAERLWPWAWSYMGSHLADQARAAELAEVVACRVSRYMEAHPGEVRSLPGLYYAATANLVKSCKGREGRIDYRGLGQDLETTASAQAPDWRQDVELWILAEQVGQHLDPTVREMFHLRLLERTWEEIGNLQGLSGGQARLRFYRALERLPEEILQDILPGASGNDSPTPQAPERGRS